VAEPEVVLGQVVIENDAGRSGHAHDCKPR
jgi:hypothetical protein